MKTPVYLKEYAKLPFIALDRDAYGDYWRYLDQLCQKRDVSSIVAAFDARSANGIRDYFLDLLREEVASRRIDLVPEKELPRLSSVR